MKVHEIIGQVSHQAREVFHPLFGEGTPWLIRPFLDANSFLALTFTLEPPASEKPGETPLPNWSITITFKPTFEGRVKAALHGNGASWQSIGGQTRSVMHQVERDLTGDLEELAARAGLMAEMLPMLRGLCGIPSFEPSTMEELTAVVTELEQVWRARVPLTTEGVTPTT